MAQPLLAQPFLSQDCAEGRHRPRRIRVASENGVTQSTCRDCGCTLVRKHPMRRWYYSGTMGGNA